jgi:catechol 2,3-dioxygenase-like lactoylglutathione lyase family enzyme/ketosteroid isomerase-like protein
MHLRLTRFDHVVLTVASIEATGRFYRDALGMEVVTFGAGRTALAFGGQKINLHEVGREAALRAARPTPGSGDLCFITERPLAEWQTHLRARGVPVVEGPVRRTGARGPIDSLYLRDPDDNLLEIAVEVGADDPLAPLRAWLEALQRCVRAGDFESGRALCAPGLIAFGTVAPFVEGLEAVMQQQWRRVWPNIRDFTIRLDDLRGEVDGDRAWVAARWDSLGLRADGSTFPRPGRLTIQFRRQDGAWLATHTHFSLSPGPAA